MQEARRDLLPDTRLELCGVGGLGSGVRWVLKGAREEWARLVSSGAVLE